MNARKLTVVLVLVLAALVISACAGENTSNLVNNDSSTNAGDAGAMNEPAEDNSAADNGNMDMNGNQDAGAGGGGMAGDDLVTIAKSETQIAQIEEPALYILSAPDEFEKIAQWFPAEERDAVAAVDYDNNYLVAAFYGVASTSGHTITVQEVYVDGGVVKVIVLREGVPEGMMAADVISYPYQLVTIPKASLDVPEGAVWEMIDTEGSLLATFTP